MRERTKHGQCAPVVICPECAEEARNIPPADQSPGYQVPDYSHRDGSTLCPTIGNVPGQNKGESQASQPVAFIPLATVTAT